MIIPGPLMMCSVYLIACSVSVSVSFDTLYCSHLYELVLLLRYLAAPFRAYVLVRLHLLSKDRPFISVMSLSICLSDS